MTDPEMADVTYIEPITAGLRERIIAKEKMDALLPTMGGPDGAQLRRWSCRRTARSSATTSS